jgi:hypothetical protein
MIARDLFDFTNADFCKFATPLERLQVIPRALYAIRCGQIKQILLSEPDTQIDPLRLFACADNWSSEIYLNPHTRQPHHQTFSMSEYQNQLNRWARDEVTRIWKLPLGDGTEITKTLQSRAYEASRQTIERLLDTIEQHWTTSPATSCTREARARLHECRDAICQELAFIPKHKFALPKPYRINPFGPRRIEEQARVYFTPDWTRSTV